MVIDFHAHTFPEAIAERALKKLGTEERLHPFTKGTNASLIEAMEHSGVDISILLPVVTKLSQTKEINADAIAVEENTGGRLISFGGLHPEDEDYLGILKQLKNGGVRGIKLHPVFQKTYCDDIRYERIVAAACELELVVMLHAGADISCPEADFAAWEHIMKLIRDVRPDRLVLAHMGSWKHWKDSERLCAECAGYDGIYLDTAFVLPVDGKECFFDTGIPAMRPEQFCKIVRMVGADRILFGTDSPWTGQLQSMRAIEKCGLSREEVRSILGENAKKLLKLK